MVEAKANLLQTLVAPEYSKALAKREVLALNGTGCCKNPVIDLVLIIYVRYCRLIYLKNPAFHLFHELGKIEKFI